MLHSTNHIRMVLKNGWHFASSPWYVAYLEKSSYFSHLQHQQLLSRLSMTNHKESMLHRNPLGQVYMLWGSKRNVWISPLEGAYVLSHGFVWFFLQWKRNQSLQWIAWFPWQFLESKKKNTLMLTWGSVVWLLYITYSNSKAAICIPVLSLSVPWIYTDPKPLQLMGEQELFTASENCIVDQENLCQDNKLFK